MQEQISDVAGLVDCPGLLAFATVGDLGPHLIHILQRHVAVPVNRLHMAQELFVVVTVDIYS